MLSRLLVVHLRTNLGITLSSKPIAHKELPDDTDHETTANIMQAFMNGFSIFSKKVASEKKLQAMCHGFLEKAGFIQL